LLSTDDPNTQLPIVLATTRPNRRLWLADKTGRVMKTIVFGANEKSSRFEI
jgi:hypothetical protein